MRLVQKPRVREKTCSQVIADIFSADVVHTGASNQGFGGEDSAGAFVGSGLEE